MKNTRLALLLGGYGTLLAMAAFALRDVLAGLL